MSGTDRIMCIIHIKQLIYANYKNIKQNNNRRSDVSIIIIFW